MNQPTDLQDISRSPRPIQGTSAIVSRRDVWDTATYWLIFLILVVTALIFKDVIIKRVEAPRTSVERDVMKHAAQLRVRPGDAVAHAGLGVAYMKMGRYSPAVSEFTLAAKLQPKNPQYHYNLAIAYRDLKRYRDALKELKAAAAYSPKWEAPHFEQGRIWLALGDYRRAAESFNDSLTLLGQDADAHYYLGLAFEKQDDKEAALFHYREALKFVPDYRGAERGVLRLAK